MVHTLVDYLFVNMFLKQFLWLVNPCMHTTSKERNGTVPQLYWLSSEKWNIHYALFSMFNPLHSNMNQQLFEKNLYNQSSHYEN